MSSERNYLKDQVFLEIAVTLGRLSTCPRGAVGAVITIKGRCVSWGFNGAPPGAPHCDDNGCGHGFGLEAARAGCVNAIHAEANAVAFAARHGISTEKGTLYVECAPCLKCAQLLIAAGIKRVVFDREFRDDAGVRLLESVGVIIDRI